MQQKEITYEWLRNKWKPLIAKTLSQNFITGLDRDDLEQEIWLVIWECFVKRDVRYLPTYLSKSIHNRVVDLYADAQRFYYPSTRVRCTECDSVSNYRPKKCECGNTHWKAVKGRSLAPLGEYSATYEPEYQEEYPAELETIVESILSGRKTGFKQKQQLRDYLEKWQD